MTAQELKELFKSKTLELEAAIEAELSHKELLTMYKELKELQYQIVQAELKELPEEKAA